MISIEHRGTFKKTDKFLNKITHGFHIRNILHRYGRKGVSVLAAHTPRDSGKTARSWGYEVNEIKNGFEIVWTNSNINNGVPIAVILQYGHGTGGGGYVQGVDYINPALHSIFKNMADDVWREVVSDG